ncbi:hypothetical protein MOX02_61590 [Methylobacterium oxalidis]|uniref:Lipoprotein n=2 Tax=Methylobacterium oxalidis TaxID=944322 RepID=A0A512JDU6_9HYPH|nr:hypothetical protein [Methylobacterium oxalidis]GEP08121.1 hypothetical protein MOX02_61590 [Methylobacterium oxalidis]
MMRAGPVLSVAATVLLCGCLQSVTIPPLEVSIKEACRGEDRLIASGEGASAYRCGKGPRARYAVYKDGRLVREVNELEIIDLAAGLTCLQAGHKLGSPEHAVCRVETANLTVAKAHEVRAAERSEAPTTQQLAEPLQLQPR